MTPAAVAPGGRRPTVDQIVRRARDLDPDAWRRLGRWTSASLRDPRLGPAIERARRRAFGLLQADPARRRTWEIASRPLFDGLAEAKGEERRWRLVMLVAHFAAVLAIVGITNGLPPVLAVAITLAAPVSAHAAWGRGTAWVGAIHAALADALDDRLDRADADRLREAWIAAVEDDPPRSPPRLGVIGALAPSALLVVAGLVVGLASAAPGR